MKKIDFSAKYRSFFGGALLTRFFCILSVIIVFVMSVSAQFGNTVSGFVFNSSRQPVSDIAVELLDDYSRTLGRTKTNASGQYRFSGVRSGRFHIKILTYGSNYNEQEQDIEIQNISSGQSSGNLSIGGYENVQKDFYLSLRKNSQPKVRADSLFVQDIPEQAKKAYQKGIELLNDKKQDEAFKQLKSAIEFFPTYYDALEKLGTEYVALKYYVPAEILLSNAVDVNPRSFKGWYGLAFAFYSENKNKEAVSAIERAIALNQSSVESFLVYGVLQRRLGNFTDAEKQLIKAKVLSKGVSPQVHWHLALLYANNLKRYGEAADELEAYLKNSPDIKNNEKIKDLINELKVKAKEKTQ
jgi:tetratricopeptide (TPR) repeat protein